MRKSFLLKAFLVLMLLSVPFGRLSAYDFCVDGVYYSVNTSSTSNEVRVTNNGEANCYSGNVIIPEYVNYNGVAYKVCYFEPSCFQDCTSLNSINIPSTFTGIGGSVFSGCTNLESITIPASITSIYDAAFERCNNISKLIIEDCTSELRWNSYCRKKDSDYYYNYFGAWSELKISDLYIGRTLWFESGIAWNPFEEWYDDNFVISSSYKHLTKLEFGSVCTNVPAIFDECSNLQKVILGESISNINAEAFNGCTALTEITLKSNVPPTCGANVFPSSIYTTCKLIVPEGTKTIYQENEVWGQFSNIVEESGSETENNPDPGIEAANSSFAIENQEIRKGRVTNIPVLMNNDISIVSFNCDITLPEGLTLAKGQYGDYDITLSERCDNTHSISASDLNGKIRVVEYSSKNHSITGNEGALFYLPVVIADDVEPETDLSIGISDIYLTEQESFKEVACQDITASLTVLPAYTPGDLNNDGKYSAADVSLAVEYALGRTPANGVAEAADVNNDGKVSAADISIIVSYVLSGKVVNSQNAPARRMLAAASADECVFTAEDITGEKGSTVELPVTVDFGDLKAVSFQCDIYLPEGVSVATDAYGEPYAELVADRIVDHTINVAKQANGAYRFLSFSNKNRTYLGKDGVMFKVPLVLDAKAGSYSIEIKAATITESETFTEFESAESATELSITEAESVVEPEDFQFYTNKLVVAEGETEATLEFRFKNSEEVSGFAFDVVLPEGMTPVLDSDGYAEIEYSDRIPSRFDVDGEEIDGVFHIEGATTRKTSVEAGDDVLFTLKLNVSTAPRFYGLNITNQTATLADGTENSVGDYTSIIKIQGTENVNLYIPNGGWATLCLPFATAVPAGLKVYKAVGIENSVVVLEEQERITANTPVIVLGAEGNYNFAENNKSAIRTNYKDGLLIGTLLDMKFSDGHVLQQQSKGFGFYRLTSAKTLPSYRCVLNNTQAADAPSYMPIRIEDTTGIDGIFKGEVDNVIYTLDGKKVNSMLKNKVYIINGDKVLIK